MAATVNSRFLAIAAHQPSLNSGFQIRVLDYKDMTSLVAIMPEFSAFSFTQELSATGTGSVTLDTNSPWWSQELNNGWSNHAIKDREYVFEAWENGIRRFAWVGQTVTTTLVGEDETHVTTISGPGIGQVLTWACIMRPGWPNKVPILKYEPLLVGSETKQIPVYRDTSPNDSLPAFLWRFPIKWTTMRIWYTTFKAAQRRGVIPMVNLMFDGLKDSNQQSWEYVRTLDTIVDNHGYQPATPGENLLEFLDDCTGQDYSKWFGQRLEWMMYPGFRLDVRRTIGVDRSKTVKFFTGQIISNDRTRDRENIYNRVVAVDVEGIESISVSPKSISTWNLREQRNDTNKNITDSTLRAELSKRYLTQSKDEKSEWAIKVPYELPGRTPYRHYFVGDYISISDSGTDYTNPQIDKYRVLAITISMSADSTVPEVELTLQSLIDSKLKELEKKVTQIVNEPNNFNIEELKNTDIGTAPTKKAALVYNPETKKWEADPNYNSSVGITAYVQPNDPSLTNTLAIGTLWLDTSA